MNKIAIAVAAAIAGTAVCVIGQTNATGRLSPAPLWPQNGDLSGYSQDRSLFLDARTNSYVIVLRSSSGTVERTLRAPIHNWVEADVDSSVSKTEDGRFLYRYTVRNGASARSPIERWAIAVEEVGHKIEMAHPSWKSTPGAPRLSGISRDRHEVYEWSTPEGGIPAGESVGQFELVSDLAPGYNLAAFYGRPNVPELSAEDWAALPPALADQLRMALGTALDSRTEQILGPRFPVNAPTDAVQANYLIAIRTLKLTARIPNDSGTANELEAALSELLLRDSTAALPDERLESLRVKARGREMEAVNGLGLALSHVRRVPAVR